MGHFINFSPISFAFLFISVLNFYHWSIDIFARAKFVLLNFRGVKS
jgi:hypothetical protein